MHGPVYSDEEYECVDQVSQRQHQLPPYLRRPWPQCPGYGVEMRPEIIIPIPAKPDDEEY